MYLSILLLPAIGSICAGLFAKILGNRGSSIIATSSILISCILSIIAFYEVGISGSPCYLELFTWIDSGMLHIHWALLYDTLTVVMLVVVTIVSLLVHVYSMGYMYHDPHIARFFSYLSMFTFFMLILVTASNFLQLFVGWEGVGISSYLLINFWYTRIQANKSAMKAMIVNRVGDFGLMLGIFAIYYVFKSIDFGTVFALAGYFIDTKFVFFNIEMEALTIICLLLFIGAIGKSAQLGLHTWLPDAMEGPTPVSALIHAATMVTAGVFLIIRCSPLLEYAPTALIVITLFGAMTAFFAATTGVVQNDLKRVIAYSTCSQLGYMVFACGISSYSVSAFHLMNHAFFKALLFLSAGSVIHALSDEQDMRKMGGISQIVPFTYIMILIGSLSLMGIPYLTGYYSKDIILELAYAHYTIHGSFAYWLGTVSAFFTSFYSFRLIYLTFYGETNSYKQVIQRAHDAPFIMALPLLVLVVGSIFVGYILKDMFIGLGTDFWGNALLVLPTNVTVLESEFLPAIIKLIPVLFSITGASIALFIYTYMKSVIYEFVHSNLGRTIYKYWNKKWYFDMFYNEFIVKSLLYVGYHITFKLLDRGFIEIIGPTGISQVIRNLSKISHVFQTGFIYNYALIFFIGVVVLLSSYWIVNTTLILLDIKLIVILAITIIYSLF